MKKNNSEVITVIETPRGSRNKYKYNSENKTFELKKILPAGTAFPLDFGFIPGTKGDDGDPLDVLVLMDVPAFPGCVIQCRILGVIEAEQKDKEEGKVRNDRIIAVASESLNYSDLKSIKDLNENLLDELIHFFKYYNE